MNRRRAAYKLTVSPVPAPIMERNLRKVLPQRQWQTIRSRALRESGLRCQSCGKRVAEPRELQAHESWTYSTSKTPATARLTEIVVCCANCHWCEHFLLLLKLTYTGQLSEEIMDEVIEHFCSVNKATREEFEKHLARREREWQRRSEFEWTVNYGPFADEVRVAQRERFLRGPLMFARSQH